MAGLKLRSNGIWYLTWYEGGKRHYQSLRTRHREIADSKRIAKEHELELRGSLILPSTTICELVKDYLASVEHGFRPTTLLRTRRVLASVVARWGDRRAAEIRTADVAGYLRELIDRGCAPGTHNRHRGILSSLWKHAVSRGIVRENAVTPVRRLQIQETTPPHLSREELAALLEAARGKPIEMGIALMALAGLRVSEAARLTWRDVDLERRVLTVRGETKTRRVRVVPLSSRLIEMLERKAPRTGTVWRKGPRAEHGRQINANRELDRAAAVAGIERHVWPHLLRHTFASHLAAAGVSLWKIAKWLGHSNVQMTMRYAHLSPQHDEEIDRVG